MRLLLWVNPVANMAGDACCQYACNTHGCNSSSRNVQMHEDRCYILLSEWVSQILSESSPSCILDTGMTLQNCNAI